MICRSPYLQLKVPIRYRKDRVWVSCLTALGKKSHSIDCRKNPTKAGFLPAWAEGSSDGLSIDFSSARL